MELIDNTEMVRSEQSFRSSAAPYLWSVAIAAAVGLVYDRLGLLVVLAAITGLSLVLLGLRDFKLICAAIILILPIAPTVLLSKDVIGISGVKIIFGLVAFACVSLFFSCALRPGTIIIPRMPRLLLLYIVVVIFAALNGARSVGQTPDYLQALGIIKDKTPIAYIEISLFVPLMITASAMAVATLAANARDPRWILFPVLASAMLLASVVCFFAIKGGATIADMADQESRRYLSGSGLHANEIGLMMNMAFAVSLAVALFAEGTGLKFLASFCSAIVLGAVFLTFSRGAYLGTLLVVVYFVITRRKWKLTIAAILLLGISLALIPDSMVKRSAYGARGNNIDDVSSGRVDEIWIPLLPSVAKHPFLGSGSGSTLWSDAAKERKMLPVGHPHSAYLAALLDVGAVGSLVVLLFLASLWRTLWQLSRIHRFRPLKSFFYGASCCIPILLIQGATDDSFMPGYTHAYLWLTYGAALGIKARYDRQRSSAIRLEN
ncbi:MAG: O-antigen ligase family protein [Limisphaerales bacterium]